MENKSIKRRKNKRQSTSPYQLLNYKTPFVIVEAYKIMRANLLFALAPLKIKTVIISSVNVGEGKSTTSANLALTLAQLGAKVILIDADMRKPTQHKVFKVNNISGLSGCLAGLDIVQETIKYDIIDNLDVLTSGSIPPNPVELLGSQNMKKLLERFEQQYDYIIIDTPPIGLISDAQVLLNQRVAIALVAKQKSTTYNEYSRTVDFIKKARGNFIGGIITYVDIEDKVYGSKYQSYSYKYE